MITSDILKLSKKLKLDSKKLVFTNGCFDILHVGHVRYLEEARTYGDFLLIGLNSDLSVKRLKGDERPFISQDDRAELLMALKCVDKVVIFDEETPLNLIRMLKPDVLVKGADYKMDEIVGAKDMISWGGEVKNLSFVDGYSTTSLVDKIQNLRNNKKS
ncbi:glycerol-3-phosphate cytidylyltransferase [PVC group bacterium (ex Bugula neritina AB1)]|nr:glycerol-3-phosphate cytidylyltransferase [PVC group bacterium (ex Bugula neritina AB1)]